MGRQAGYLLDPVQPCPDPHCDGRLIKTLLGEKILCPKCNGYIKNEDMPKM